MTNLDTKAIKDRLAKNKLPANPQQRVKDNIINWFLNEQPAADNITVVAGTLKNSNRNSAYWETTVQTTVYLPVLGPKVHNSRVFFYVDKNYNIIQKKVNFKTI